MIAEGRLVDTKESSFTNKEGQAVYQFEVKVLTSEAELVSVRSTGTKAIDGLMAAIDGVENFGEVRIPVCDSREFGGRTVWKHYVEA